MPVTDHVVLRQQAPMAAR